MKNNLKVFFVVALSTLCFCFALLYFVNIFSTPGAFLSNKVQSAKPSKQMSINGESLIALNNQSKNYKVNSNSKKTTLQYKFTEKQKTALITATQKTEGAAVRITIESLQKKHTEETSLFTFGFLYKDENSNELVASSKKVVCHLPQQETNFAKTFALSICVEPNSKVPDGFYVTGQDAYELKNILFTESVIGWDKSTEVPLFAFCATGGECYPLSSSFDFSFAASQFIIPPKLVIKLKDLESIGTYTNQTKVKVLYGNDLVSIRRVKKQGEVTIQTSALHTPFSSFAVQENAEQILSVLLKPNPQEQKLSNGAVLTPLVSDLGLIMTWQKRNWRYTDYELYRWESFPKVLFFDFANYKVQDEYFTRLAYFAEKTGYKGTLVGDDFIKNKHGYNAHDYKAYDLANFFTTAKKQNFALNQREIDLCAILQANGIIRYNKETQTFEEGEGAIVSFSRESPDYLRWQFLAHESWHGIYFTESSFRKMVYELYNSFNEQSMEFLKNYWTSYPSLNYDRSDEYLMQNEFMGYLMQQNLNSVRKYFLEKASWKTVDESFPELTQYVRQTQAQDFVDAATKLNEYAFANYGLAAGRVSLISLE